MPRPKKLLFISLNYPFHYADSYIEPEFYKIATLFDEVTIYSLTKENLEPRRIPANAKAEKLPDRNPGFSFAGFMRCILSGMAFSELYDAFFRYRYNPSGGIIKQTIKYYIKASCFLPDLRNWLEKNKDADCMIYTYFMIEPTLAAAMLKDHYSFSLVSRLHRYDLYFERGEYGYLPYRRFLVKKLDALFFIAQDGLTYFRDKLAPNAEGTAKLRLQRLGINPEGAPVFTYMKPDPITLVSTSWILANKRLGLIAEALIKLSGRVRVRWVHFGGHRLIEGDYYEQFTKLIDTLRVSCPDQQVELMGNTPKEDIFEFFRKNYVHMFVNVSESEGIPISMMEAMSFGIPVAGTNVGGVNEIVDHNQNGFLLSPDLEADELARTIEAFSRLGEQDVVQMRNRAYAKYMNNFLAEKNYSSFAEELQAIMN